MSAPVSSPRDFKIAAYLHLATVGKALSNATRLELLELLVQGPRSVEELATEVGQSVANTSHHLQALKAAKLATCQREGQRIVYSKSGEDVGHLVDILQRVAANHSTDLAKLSSEFFADRDSQAALDASALANHMSGDESVLLDVRPEREFEAGHLDGARGIPLAELSLRLEELPMNKTIVVYCRGPYCVFSADAVELLRASGRTALRATIGAHSPLVQRAESDPGDG